MSHAYTYWGTIINISSMDEIKKWLKINNKLLFVTITIISFNKLNVETILSMKEI